MKPGKRILAILLVIACILSAIILAATPPVVEKKIYTHSQLDSLIQLSFTEANLRPDQIRSSTVEIDTSFSRKVYRVRVAPSFSKTSFHLMVHKRFYDLGLDTPTRVVFPERDMNIYFSYNDTIIRTIRLITDKSQVEAIETQE
ncbi:MAG: hypothetical protein RLN81_09070 [Balneolaceae bacterium]